MPDKTPTLPLGYEMHRLPFTAHTTALLEKRSAEISDLRALSESEIQILAERLEKKFRKCIVASIAALFISSQAFSAPAADIRDIVQTIIAAESSGNPGAVGDGGKSRGLMQIQEETWKRYSNLSFDKAFDPELNRCIGSAIVKDIITRYRARGIEPSKAYIIWAYNTGSLVKRSLPKFNKKGEPHPWTINHPNKVYRSVYIKALQ